LIVNGGFDGGTLRSTLAGERGLCCGTSCGGLACVGVGFGKPVSGFGGGFDTGAKGADGAGRAICMLGVRPTDRHHFTTLMVVIDAKLTEK